MKAPDHRPKHCVGRSASLLGETTQCRPDEHTYPAGFWSDSFSLCALRSISAVGNVSC